MKKLPHKHILRITALALALALVAGFVFLIPSRAADTSSLLKLLDSYTVNSSKSFTLSTSSRIYIVAATVPNEDLKQTVQLAQRKFAAAGYPSSSVLPIYWGDESGIATGDIVVYLNASANVGAEGYALDLGDVAKVTAKDTDGLLYGLDMLLKHFRNANSSAGGAVTIQGFTAADTPDTAERTVMLDCGRKYYTKEWICNFIREMSWMGYNTLELHFSEDSGFRIDIWDSAYYTDTFNPANDFSWICGGIPTYWQYEVSSTGNGYYRTDCPNGYADMSKYLTAKELVEICEVAKEYHIDIIPSFDSPAHLDYLMWKFQANYKSNTSYSFKSTYDNGTTYKASSNSGIINYTNNGSNYNTAYSKWPYYAGVNINQAMGKAFIFELYIDIANFFKEYAGSTDFSIGADEVNLTSSYNPQWDYDDFVAYINELAALLKGKGYTVRAFNDFLGSTVNSATSALYDSDIEIMYWNSPFDPDSKTTYGSGNTTQPASHWVNAGRTIYNCIQTSTYYALRYQYDGSTDARDSDSGQNSWTFYDANEEDIYNNWYPANINETGDYDESVAEIPDANLGGGYFLIWCDFFWINSEQEIWDGAEGPKTKETYYLRDRMWSNIIKMWNTDVNSTVTYSNFSTMRAQFGTCPGVSSCSTAASLPAATDPVAANVTYTHTVTYKCAVHDRVLRTETVEAKAGSFQIALTGIRGYCPVRAENATYVTQGGVEYVQGAASANLSITVWCQEAGDDSWLNDVLRTENMEVQENGAFTYDYASWAAYESAIKAAQTAEYTSQEDIDELVADIQAAHNALVVKDYTGESFIEVRQLAQSYPEGKQVGLQVVTSPDVRFLTVTNGEVTEELTLESAQVQEINGEIVKVWLLYIPADEAGSYTYTVGSNAVSATVEVEVD